MLKKFFETSQKNLALPEEPAKLALPALAPVIGIIGAKGGVGATSISINLGAALSLLGYTTTIVDANLQQPDVANMVGQEPEHSFLEMLNRKDFLDEQIFEACQVKIGDIDSSLSLISPPLDGKAGFKTNLSELASCISSIRAYSNFWIVDLPRYIDKNFVNITDLCDKILLVFEANIQGFVSCRRWLNIFNELGYSKDKIICVLNRSGGKYASVEQKLSEYFTEEIIFRIPNASSIAWDCSTKGVSMVLSQSNHKYSQAMIKIAQDLSRSFLEE